MGGSTAMDPKTMLIKPENTADAAEKQAEAEAEAQARHKHCDDIHQFLNQSIKALEEEPERMIAIGKEIGADYSFEVDNVDLIRTAAKMLTGEHVSEEEISDFFERAPSLMGFLRESLHKDMSEKTPEERAKFVKATRELVGDDPIRRLSNERALRELNLVDSEEPSEPDKDNA